ncbi:DUF4168 domain-containing protein [Thalassospira sp. MA62]|nr:DUF4168 domain-containing protein [Thalassospira sp. MA62]
MKRFPMVRVLSIATGGFMLMAAPALAQAQSANNAPQQLAQSGQTQQTQFSDEKLQQYASAVTEIQQLNTKWQQRIQQSEDPNEAQALRQDASEEMIGAVRDEGLTLDEYNQITTAATNNPELSSKITSYLR